MSTVFNDYFYLFIYACLILINVFSYRTSARVLYVYLQRLIYVSFKGWKLKAARQNFRGVSASDGVNETRRFSCVRLILKCLYMLVDLRRVLKHLSFVWSLLNCA